MRKLLTAFILFISLTGYAQVKSANKPLKGLASFMGKREQGKRMANGHLFDNRHLTAACNKFPLGTILQVTFTLTDQTVIVEVTDRGPFVRPRVIDLSEAAAKAIGLYRYGVGQVEIQRLN